MNTRETFSHMISCENTDARQFRLDLQEQIALYFHRHNLPDDFSHQFLEYYHLWFTEKPKDDTVNYTATQALASQRNIGWSLMMKGFISREWRYMLSRSRQQRGETSSQSTTQILAGLIQLLWTSQIKFWNQQMAQVEGTKHQNTQRYQDRHQELSTKIRLLHERQHMVLHAHRDHYFFEHVDNFLGTATISQMKAYLHHYEPAIEASIQAAKRIVTPPLTSFPGFTKTRRTMATPVQRRRSPEIIVTENAPIAQAMEVHQTHKHTRWKQPQLVIPDLRHYFRSLSTFSIPPLSTNLKNQRNHHSTPSSNNQNAATPEARKSKMPNFHLEIQPCRVHNPTTIISIPPEQYRQLNKNPLPIRDCVRHDSKTGPFHTNTPGGSSQRYPPPIENIKPNPPPICHPNLDNT